MIKEKLGDPDRLGNRKRAQKLRLVAVNFAYKKKLNMYFSYMPESFGGVSITLFFFGNNKIYLFLKIIKIFDISFKDNCLFAIPKRVSKNPICFFA